MEEASEQRHPPIPPEMTLREFGASVMQWGAGDTAAVSRINTITLDWLKVNGVTLLMAVTWREFYKGVYDRNPANPSARGRMVLMDYCAKLFEESP